MHQHLGRCCTGFRNNLRDIGSGNRKRGDLLLAVAGVILACEYHAADGVVHHNIAHAYTAYRGVEEEVAAGGKGIDLFSGCIVFNTHTVVEHQLEPLARIGWRAMEGVASGGFQVNLCTRLQVDQDHPVA